MIKFALFIAASFSCAAFAQNCTVDVDGMQIVIANGSAQILAHGEVLPLADQSVNRNQDLILTYNDEKLTIHINDHKTGLLKTVSDVSVSGLTGPDAVNGVMTCEN